MALLIGGPGHGRRIEIHWLVPYLDFPLQEPLRAIDFSHLTEVEKDPVKIKIAQYSLYDDCPVKYIYEGMR